MAYSCRMACTSAHHLLLLAFLLFILQHSHMPCEARPTYLNNIIGTNDATNPTSSEVLLQEAKTVTNLRAFFQSIVDLLHFQNATQTAGHKNQLDFEKESELEAPEKIIDTSGAGFIYNAENQVEQEDANTDEAAAEEPHLLMPFQKPASTPGNCKTGNYIDDCWRCDANWQDRRQALASCAIGFGQYAYGGKDGKIYVVTSNNDDIRSPSPGTLRYGVTRSEPLWITFAKDMTIELKGELIVSSYKTIDGRGAEIHIVGTSQITIEGVSNVIVHGIHVHDILTSGPHHILTAPNLRTFRGSSDGDAIHIKGSSNVWVDHCFLAKATDGLVDGTKNSTNITVSNSYFENHNKVMLFGASPKDDYDRNMQITVAFNRFGPGLTQRLPRCRYGSCHVANNFYTSGWGLYAIGGSEDPTFLSQCNRFVAPDATNRKEVTSRIDDDGPTFGGWQKWDWVSTGDSFANGAFFTGSGVQNASASNYDRARSFVPRHASWVAAMTEDAGPLNCVPKSSC
ncbi:hypothetical protein KC19_2G045700 [Ceratodon purpureus]|uniref:Pectate lyase n=2 Tax=Ceratodon purpureus TaxID=3225 RepID=A0A8T0IQ61_CERPU|nr:hypothetical protein KC19_2G045700 [Ceratodon purpureus]